MTHFVVFPSSITSRANVALEAWHDMGYRSLVFQDIGSTPCNANVVQMGTFPGYYKIANNLSERALEEGADLVTFASDDMRPDPNKRADDIAQFYWDLFPHGDGVMQATGDRQGIDESGKAASERICGSPTFGREWIMRSYEGHGPFWSGYHSYYADEDLYNVSKSLGLLWQEPSLTIMHLHWSWGHMPMMPYHERNQTKWEADQKLFQTRKTAGFPNSGLLKL